MTPVGPGGSLNSLVLYIFLSEGLIMEDQDGLRFSDLEENSSDEEGGLWFKNEGNEVANPMQSANKNVKGKRHLDKLKDELGK